MLLVTPNQGLAFPGLIFQLNFDSKHIITHKNDLQTILLLMERIQNTIIVSFILFWMDRVFLLFGQYVATIISTYSSVIVFLFRPFRNGFGIVFYLFIDSLTVWFWEYSECWEEFLCWGLGVCSICLFVNVFCKSSNLDFLIYYCF